MSRAVTRRSALSAAALPLALAAGAGPAQPSTGQPGAPLSQESATIAFLGRGSITNQQSFEELSRRFTQEVAPKVNVQYTHEPGNFDEKYQVLASGGQTPDVAFGTVANNKVHVARGSAAYLDELAKRDKAFKEADYDAYWLEALRYKSRLAGLPWDPGMVALQFNKNIFNKEGLKTPDTTTPMSWEDVAELSKRFVKQDTQLAQARL